jgi:hypothetical protein
MYIDSKCARMNTREAYNSFLSSHHYARVLTYIISNPLKNEIRMKKFCVCIALLAATVITASDQPKQNPAVERVKKTDSASNSASKIDRPEGRYHNGSNKRVISSASRNNRLQSAQQPPKAKNPNS